MKETLSMLKRHRGGWPVMLCMELSITILYIGMLLGAPMVNASSVDGGSLIRGVGTHLFRGDRDVVASLEALRRAGVTSIREDASWAKVETTPGVLQVPQNWDFVVEEAAKRGISVVVVLAYGNRLFDTGNKPSTPAAINAYANYAQFVVHHFKGRVKVFEIWNEWDGRAGNTEPGAPEGYLAVLESVYPRLKREDPSGIFIGGSATSYGVEKGFLNRLVDLGLLEHVDGVSIHVYTYCKAGGVIDAWYDHVDKVESDLRWRTGNQVALFITETGWPTFVGKCGVDEATQARNLAGVFNWSQKSGFVKGVWWYDLQDDGNRAGEAEDHFGLLRRDLSPKPAYDALLHLDH